MNETYEVTFESPLLRPGITIKTKVSKRYLVETVRGGLDMVREINNSHAPQQIDHTALMRGLR